MDKNKLSPWEAKRNLSEMVEKIGQDHAIEVEKRISEAIYEEILFNFGETLHENGDPEETMEQELDDLDWDLKK